MIHYKCSRCFAEMEAPQSLAGKKQPCRVCKQDTRVPDAIDELAAVQAIPTTKRRRYTKKAVRVAPVVHQRVNVGANGLGITGMVLGIISVVFFWSCISILTGPIGLALSFAGLFHRRNGMAIAGLVLNLLGMIPYLLILLGLAGVAAQ